jgi:hypothetical protein
MKKLGNVRQLVLTLYFLLGFFAFPHLIDDFLFGIPAEFGLSVQTTQVLSGVFLVLYSIILRGLAIESRSGLYGSIFLGLFLALAGILKHIPLMLKPGPYWSGLFSEGLIIGMIISGVSLAITAVFALKMIQDSNHRN